MAFENPLFLLKHGLLFARVATGLDKLGAAAAAVFLLFLAVHLWAMVQAFDAHHKAMVAAFVQSECAEDTLLEGDTARYILCMAYAGADNPTRAAILVLVAVALASAAWAVAVRIVQPARFWWVLIVAVFVAVLCVADAAMLGAYLGNGGRTGRVPGATAPIAHAYDKLVAALPADAATRFQRLPEAYKKELIQRYRLADQDSTKSDDEVATALAKEMKDSPMQFLRRVNAYVDRQWGAASPRELKPFFARLETLKMKDAHNPAPEMRDALGAYTTLLWVMLVAAVFVMFVLPFLARSTVGRDLFNLHVF